MLSIPIKQLDHAQGLDLPAYQSAGAAGLDLACAIEEALTLAPGQTALVPTGLVMEIPQGYEAQVRPRSGLAFKHGVTVLNAPGTIDSDYRGELKVLLINHGAEALKITRGMRIAQLVIAPVTQAQWVALDAGTPTARASGGFGSSGA